MQLDQAGAPHGGSMSCLWLVLCCLPTAVTPTLGPRCTSPANRNRLGAVSELQLPAVRGDDSLPQLVSAPEHRCVRVPNGARAARDAQVQ